MAGVQTEIKNIHLPKNVKVHFAGSEVQNQYIVAMLLGVSYTLFTAYPWVERKIFQTPKSPIMPLDWQRENSGVLIPQYLTHTHKNVIQDSGLFTLMFGSQKSVKKDEQLINKWYDGLVQFTLEHGAPVVCVECDCQKVLGVEKAWEFRRRMRNDIPNRIINVFHLEDGMKGLDRLIEFSDYIAISVPELRFAGKKNYVPQLARYIKNKKPTIDIHLLGCTELDLLKECRFATSADSTTWIAPKRFGYINGKHIRSLDYDKCRALVSDDTWEKITKYNSEPNAACIITSTLKCMEQYSKYAGDQEYGVMLNQIYRV